MESAPVVAVGMREREGRDEAVGEGVASALAVALAEVAEAVAVAEAAEGVARAVRVALALGRGVTEERR